MAKTFAHISNNVVANILVANTLADAEFVTGGTCIEYTDKNPANIGWIYDPATKKFVEPVVEQPTVVEPKALGN